MIRVVIDTNVVVSAALQRLGQPAAILRLVMNREIMVCVSERILEEYREVLSRARIGVDPDQATLMHELFSTAGDLVSPSVAVNECHDPDDNMFLECALEAGADFLITGNAADFPAQFKSTRVVTPRGFLEAWYQMNSGL